MQFSKLCLTVLCTVLCFTTLSAQNNLSEGYYVNLKKDTIHGFFNFDELFVNKILFYANSTTSVSKTLLPDSLQQIETLDKMSIRSFINTFRGKREPLFVSKLTDGKVMLFRGKSANAEEDELFFISSDKVPELRKITKTNPKAFLNTYFKGCELGNFATVRYSRMGILTALNEINKCAYPNQELVVNKAKTYPIKLEFGVKAGVFINTSKTTNIFGDRKVSPKASPVFGIVLGLDMSNSVKVYTGINLFTRHLVVSDSFKTNVYYQGGGGYVSYLPPFKLTTTYAEIPIAIHFEFNKRKPVYIPKFIAGGSALMPFAPKIENIGKSGNSYNVSNFYENIIHPTFFIGGGIKKKLNNNAIAELLFRGTFDYEYPISEGQIKSTRYELTFNYIFSSVKK